ETDPRPGRATVRSSGTDAQRLAVIGLELEARHPTRAVNEIVGAVSLRRRARAVSIEPRRLSVVELHASVGVDLAPVAEVVEQRRGAVVQRRRPAEADRGQDDQSARRQPNAQTTRELHISEDLGGDRKATGVDGTLVSEVVVASERERSADGRNRERDRARSVGVVDDGEREVVPARPRDLRRGDPQSGRSRARGGEGAAAGREAAGENRPRVEPGTEL